MHRIESIDYLRGLMAVSVMIYHYLSWSIGDIGGGFLLGKLGIYAVAIFYILSGLSLAIVYRGRINDFDNVRDFIVKRVFRIFPLFWLAVTAVLVSQFVKSYLSGSEYVFPLYHSVLNYTLLFGFLEPAAYLPVGAWSIGNEIVFYGIFAIILLISKRSAIILPLCITLSFVVGCCFAFFGFDEAKYLSEQWTTYINPFNQLFLFMGGVGIGIYGNKIRHFLSSSVIWIIILALSFILFYLLPANGDLIQVVTGVKRVILSFLCMCFVLALFLLNPAFKSLPAKILSFFGEGCYSIYLLHPLVAMPIVFAGTKLGFGRYVAFSVSFFLTLFVSWFTFKFLEKPAILAGKRVVTKLSQSN